MSDNNEASLASSVDQVDLDQDKEIATAKRRANSANVVAVVALCVSCLGLAYRHEIHLQNTESA